MITDYIAQAMKRARYELMEDGRYFGTIPGCTGVWAEARTLDGCRGALQETLEDWLLLGLQLGHKLPVVGGVDLNRTTSRRIGGRQPAHA